jgi:hypothetical protein
VVAFIALMIWLSARFRRMHGQSGN